MWDTPITRDYGLRLPLIGAGMAMISLPALVAAVCEAGALGQLGTGPIPPSALRELIQGVRARTRRPFAVNLIVATTAFGAATTDEHVAVCAHERVPVVVFFWNAPMPGWLATLHDAGCRVWSTVGSLAEAQAAHALGVDAQGREAGGHARARSGLLDLLASIVAMGRGPVIAAGGIGDGRAAALALQAGAAAVCVGTCLVASEESVAHPEYKARLVSACSRDTVVTDIFGPEWPGAPMRVLVNRAVRRAADGSTRTAPSPIGETRVFGRVYAMPAYSAVLPTDLTRGDLEEMCLPAGTSVDGVRAIRPAAEIVREIMEEAAFAQAAM